MSPNFFTRVAVRFFARRWWFLAASVLGMALLFAAFSSSSIRVAAVAVTLAGPFVFVTWAMLCACAWFHPEHGNLRLKGRLFGKLPNAVQLGVRWYASLFLALCFVVGVIVWPALSIAWM
jgi:hypothetical protein